MTFDIQNWLCLLGPGKPWSRTSGRVVPKGSNGAAPQESQHGQGAVLQDEPSEGLELPGPPVYHRYTRLQVEAHIVWPSLYNQVTNKNNDLKKKFRLGNILLQKGNQKDLGLIGFFLCVFYNYMQQSGGEMQPSLKEFIFTQSVCFSKLSVSCGSHTNKRWNFVFQIVKKKYLQ